MKRKRRADLPCRPNCPYFNGRLDNGLRPCVTKVGENETFCVKQIKEHFASLIAGEISFKTLKKRIIVSESGFPMGIVANGVAILFKSQP